MRKTHLIVTAAAAAALALGVGTMSSFAAPGAATGAPGRDERVAGVQELRTAARREAIRRPPVIPPPAIRPPAPAVNGK